MNIRMCSRRREARFTLLLAAVFGLAGFHPLARGGVVESFVEPSESDNFYEARSRFWTPEGMSEARGILVILHGTDSDARGEASSPFWQRIARRERLPLLGCYFRGEGEPYEEAAGGSGAALLKMIGQVAAATKIRGLSDAPLVFVGHSAGAMFVYRFTAWAPEKVAGFVAVKTGPLTPGSDPRAAAVPGLFIVGERDLDGRVRSAAEAFLWQKQHGGLGSFAIERNHGHEWTPAISELIDAYVKGLCSLLGFQSLGPARGVAISAREGCWGNLRAPSGKAPPLPQDEADAVWLPGSECAAAWARFTGAGSVRALAERTAAPAPPPLEVSPGTVSMDALHADDAPHETEQLVTVHAGNGEALECIFTPEDARLTVSAARAGPNTYRLKLRLAVKEPSGSWYRAGIRIDASGQAGQAYSGSLTVNAPVESAFQLTPGSIYVGVLSRGKVLERSITITCKDGHNWKLLAARSSNPAFAQARSVETNPGGTSLLCRFDTANVLGNQSGRFELEFDHNARIERVFVPFIAFISKKTSEVGTGIGR